MITMTVGEATSVVQEILNMLTLDVITKEQAFAAIKKIPHYEDIFAVRTV